MLLVIDRAQIARGLAVRRIERHRVVGAVRDDIIAARHQQFRVRTFQKITRHILRPEGAYRAKFRHRRLRQHHQIGLRRRRHIQQLPERLVGVLAFAGLEAARRVPLHERHAKIGGFAIARRPIAHHPVPHAKARQDER